MRRARGSAAQIRIKFVDQYSNTALPGSSFQFGMAFLKEKERVANVCYTLRTLLL